MYITMQTSLEIDLKEVEVTGDVIPGEPPAPHADPPEPGSPPEVEGLQVLAQLPLAGEDWHKLTPARRVYAQSNNEYYVTVDLAPTLPQALLQELEADLIEAWYVEH